jgi:hypothetical protein
MNFCRHQIKHNGTMPNRSTGRGSAHGLISALWPERLEDFTAKELADSVTRLFDRGELVEREYKRDNRSKAFKLEPKDAQV